MVELLEWDSKFFNRRIARLQSKRLAETDIPAVFDWCKDNRVECLYFLADAQDELTAHLASECGFVFVDMRLTFAAGVNDLQPVDLSLSQRAAIGLFEEPELEQLKKIARVSHRDTRFYFDQQFPREKCDALYEIWIERSCRGWAQAVLVARENGEAIGYCTCHVTPDGSTGSIGLIAVKEGQQGGGIGQQLVSAAAIWLRDEQVSRIQVVTQARNRAAQRLYQRLRFRTDSAEVWYHHWFSSQCARGI